MSCAVVMRYMRGVCEVYDGVAQPFYSVCCANPVFGIYDDGLLKEMRAMFYFICTNFFVVRMCCFSYKASWFCDFYRDGLEVFVCGRV